MFRTDLIDIYDEAGCTVDRVKKVTDFYIIGIKRRYKRGCSIILPRGGVIE